MTPEFRAWDKKNEIYLYNVQYAYDTLSGFIKYDDGKNATYDESCFGDFLDNKRYDTEQFTGLKDKHGNKIFEGDIVRNEHEKTRVVNFKEGSFLVEDFYFGSIGAGMGLEIIGNVHENLELLEAEK
jgi:uncharacterized phage protein (TIGR01671 family)